MVSTPLFIIRTLSSNQDAKNITIESIKNWGDYYIYDVERDDHYDFFHYNRMFNNVLLKYKNIPEEKYIILLDAGMILEKGELLLQSLNYGNKSVYYATEQRYIYYTSRILICRFNPSMIIVGNLKPKIRPNVSIDILHNVIFSWKTEDNLKKIIEYENLFLLSRINIVKSKEIRLIEPPVFQSKLNVNAKEFTPPNTYSRYQRFSTIYYQQPVYYAPIPVRTFYSNSLYYPHYNGIYHSPSADNSPTPKLKHSPNLAEPRLNKSADCVTKPLKVVSIIKNRYIYGIGSYDIYHCIMNHVMINKVDDVCEIAEIIIRNSNCKRYKILASYIIDTIRKEFSNGRLLDLATMIKKYGEFYNSEYLFYMSKLYKTHHSLDKSKKYLLKAHIYMNHQMEPYLFFRNDIGYQILMELNTLKILDENIINDALLNTNSPYNNIRTQLYSVNIAKEIEAINVILIINEPLRYYNMYLQLNVAIGSTILTFDSLWRPIPINVKRHFTDEQYNISTNNYSLSRIDTTLHVNLIEANHIVIGNFVCSKTYPFSEKIFFDDLFMEDFVIVAACGLDILMYNPLLKYYRLVVFNKDYRVSAVGNPIKLNYEVIGISYDYDNTLYNIIGNIDNKSFVYIYKHRQLFD